MSEPTQHERKDEPARAIVARFQSRSEAREAISALHKAKYKHTWLGTTSVAETPSGETITVESGGFFSGTESLVDALVSRGVPGETARNLEGALDAGDALVTIDPKDEDPATALDILRSYGGEVAGGQSVRATRRDFAMPETDGSRDADFEYEEAVFFQR